MADFHRPLTSERRAAATSWLNALGSALERKDYSPLRHLIHPDGYWRDLLTLGWEFTNRHGIEEIEHWMAGVFDINPAREFQLEGEPFAGSLGEHKETLE